MVLTVYRKRNIWSTSPVLLINNMTDPYHEIYNGEIFVESRCIWHENTLLDFLRSNLISFGYQSVDESNKTWRRGDRTVIVCLVDDFTTCAQRFDLTLPYLFDSNTVVITDTKVQTPTQYQVCQLPVSFFGIYSHSNNHTWNPSRRFAMGVNRIDAKRLLLFLELAMRSQHMGQDLDWINFNCWRWGGDNQTAQGLQQNFQSQYQELEPQYREVYDQIYNEIWSLMPFNNHQFCQEQLHVNAWLNIVMETYSADNTIALSEKTFRALCSPAPWQLYAGRNTVAYLHSLGFDTLQDIVTHRYDSMIENRTAAYGDKMVDFLFEATESVASMQLVDFDVLVSRCQKAAMHNQQVLDQMQRVWPAEFAAWLPTVIDHIK